MHFVRLVVWFVTEYEIFEFKFNDNHNSFVLRTYCIHISIYGTNIFSVKFSFLRCNLFYVMRLASGWNSLFCTLSLIDLWFIAVVPNRPVNF